MNSEKHFSQKTSIYQISKLYKQVKELQKTKQEGGTESTQEFTNLLTYRTKENKKFKRIESDL